MFKNLGLTKREKTVLIVLGVLMFILTFIHQDVINDYKVPLLVVVFFPLGITVAMDSERMHK